MRKCTTLCTYGLVGMLFVVVSAMPALAANTPIVGGSPTLNSILVQLYPNGETLTRVDDFPDGASPADEGLVIDLLQGPGITGRTDQSWTDGVVFVDVRVKYAGFNHAFGWERDGIHDILFNVVGSDFNVSGSADAVDVSGGVFRWIDQTNPGVWSSDVSANSDGKDHMITYLVSGGNTTSTTWVLCWDDQAGGGDRDFNDMIIEVIIDDCPDDPNKTSPGQCGCGVPDDDSDGDTVADCLDTCPNDPNKTAPGQCGCGVADTDSDEDGTADCVDGCPSDPDKTAPGACGCGVADTPTDGTADCDADNSDTAPGLQRRLPGRSI